MRDNQCAKIVRYCRDYGSITQLDAMREFGIFRLASRISDLRRKGFEIESVMEEGTNRYGEKTRYARYFISL